MKSVKSCGVILFRRQPECSFLLMKHPTRWDLPKGHVDPGETDLQCALRELAEETGIEAADIELDETFQFLTKYQVRDRDSPKQSVEKSLRLYLAWLKRDVPVVPSEHESFAWIRWNPPHAIQEFTIDPLLQAVEQHWSQESGLGG